MTILEQHLQGKFNDEQKCEDTIFISDDFIAVIDGATSKAETNDTITSGKRAAQLISEVLSTLPSDTDMSSAIASINIRIAEYYQNNKGVAHYWDNPAERLTASAVIYSKTREELWMVGDCIALVNGELILNHKKFDDVCADLRSAFITNQLIRKETTIDQLMVEDSGREFILPLLKWSAQFQNCGYEHEYAHSEIDGFSVSPALTKCIKVSGSPKIVLASDGYPELKETLKESENVLSYLLENDPLCINLFKSTKGLRKGAFSFDDRSYISFVG